jgi:hypothetical protein
MTDPHSDTGFYIGRDGQQYGPYSQSQILEMLQLGQVGKKDLVYYEGLGNWMPLDTVFEVEEQLHHLMDEGQEHEVVAEVYRHVDPLLSSGEKMFYIAHQKKKLMRPRPGAAVATDRRVIFFSHTLTGTSIEDCAWGQIDQCQLKEGLLGTNFCVVDKQRHLMEVEDIPREQAMRLHQIASEMQTNAKSA